MDTLVGRRLGKYQIESLVGRGGMAAVYRAHDTALNRSVAIKVLEPSLAIDPKSVERFKREAVTAANLEHPSIVRVYDVQQESGVHFIAMRYVQGTTLRNIMRDNGPLPLDAIVNVIKPVASALHYAHRHGVIHRDVKPGNILVEPDGTVLLTDFGIARAGGGSQSALTTTGQVMGTADYLAPEQIIGRPAEARSDTYSLGVVLYEMLTGVTPFGGENTASILYRQVHDTPTAIRSINPRLPIELQSIVDRALAKNPAMRYADPLDLARDLEETARHLPPGSPWLAHRQEQATIAIAENKRPSGALYPPPISRPAPPPAPKQKPPPNNANRNAGPKTQNPKPKTQNQQVIAPPKFGGRSIWPLLLAAALLLVGALLLAMAAGVLPGLGGSAVEEGRFQPPGEVTYTGQLRKNNGPDIHIPKALVPPIVDGDLADWAGSSPNPYPARFVTLGETKWKGPDDLSSDFYFAWDSENFYIGAIVTDDLHVQLPGTRGDNLYSGDDIEIWFDTNLNGDFAISTANKDDYQMGLSPGNFKGLGPEAYFWNPDRSGERNKLVNVAARQQPGGKGYTLEAAVPWTAFGDFRPQPGGAIGFAASAGDTDLPGGKQEIMVSTAPSLRYRQPATFGNLFF